MVSMSSQPFIYYAEGAEFDSAPPQEDRSALALERIADALELIAIQMNVPGSPQLIQEAIRHGRI